MASRTSEWRNVSRFLVELGHEQVCCSVICLDYLKVCYTKVSYCSHYLNLTLQAGKAR